MQFHQTRNIQKKKLIFFSHIFTTSEIDVSVHFHMSVDDGVGCAKKEIEALKEDLKESQQNEEHFRKLSVFYKEESARSEESKASVLIAFTILKASHEELMQKLQTLKKKIKKIKQDENIKHQENRQEMVQMLADVKSMGEKMKQFYGTDEDDDNDKDKHDDDLVMG